MTKRKRSLAAAAAVLLVVAAAAIVKPMVDSDATAERRPSSPEPTLEETVTDLRASSSPVIIGFFLEGYACCAGVQITYDTMRESLEELVGIATEELALQAILIDIGTVPAGDREFAWRLAGEFGFQTFNGVAMLTGDNEPHALIEGPYYSRERLRSAAEELTSL